MTISSDYDITVDPTTLTVRFTVTGENSASYNSISELNITVQASSEPTNTLTAVTIRADNIGRTSATLYATTSVNPAIIQWYCAA